jgi:outer membrane protein OmpA-like peptidoglycan-associated protein
MGEDMPLDPRSNEQAWAQNRRAEFTSRPAAPPSSAGF